MADPKKEVTTEPTVEQLKAQLEAVAKERDELKEAVAANEAAGNVSPVVKGKVALQLEDADGKKTKKTVGIRDGRKNIRLKDGIVVNSETFLKYASGATLTDEEKEVPALKALGQQGCLDYLTSLFASGASMIVEK